MEIGNTIPEPFVLGNAFERVKFPPRGAAGGMDGQAGSVSLSNGVSLNDKGSHVVPVGLRAILKSPGGAGTGDPRHRDRAAIAQDLADGYITAAAARAHYGYTE